MLYVFINIFLVLTIFIVLLLYFSYITYNIETKEMQPQDAKFLKRKIKSGPVDVHPTEKALVLNYELEYHILGEKGDEVFKEKKNLEKIIALPLLNSKTDNSALGKAIIEKCELIHPSKLAEIEQLIYYLKSRKYINRTDSNVSRSSSAASVKSVSAIETKSENASIINVDEYIELLYEDIPEKIKGSALILQLARETDNLEALAKNESVLSALSRVLREDWKKSIVLSTNLIYTFFCFSTYTDFHHIILNYKIGSLCMDIIDFELIRYDEWRTELQDTETGYEKEKIDRKTCPNSASMSEITRSKIPEPVRPRSGNWAEAFNNGTSKAIMTGSTYEDLSTSTDNIEERKQLSDFERAKRYRTLIRKQEQLLRVAFYLLLNISEDEGVEEKMVKKNIVGMLVKTLERENEDLLILVVTFLKKLSIFEVNKEMMAELDIIDRLPRLLHYNNVELIHLTLKLLFNLSFDVVLRSKMVKRGFLPKLVSLLCTSLTKFTLHNILNKKLYLKWNNILNNLLIKYEPKAMTLQYAEFMVVRIDGRRIEFHDGTFLIESRYCTVRAKMNDGYVIGDERQQQVVIRLLYHFSHDDKVKAMFTYTDCVSLITDMILLCKDDKDNQEMIALGINLAINQNNAEQMIENNRLHNLMTRAFKYQNCLLMKMIRNISEHKTLQPLFLEFIGDLARALTDSKQEEFIQECVGVLGNIWLPDLDYAQIFQHFKLIPWLKNLLKPNATEDDFMLDLIVFMGTAAADKECAQLLCQSQVLQQLIELLKVHQEDDEFVYQIIYVFLRVLQHDECKDYVIIETDAAAYMIDLNQDQNKIVSKICDTCLDIISARNTDWARRIQIEKFRNHNSQWLQMIESNAADDVGFEDDIMDELPPYMNAEFLATHSVPNFSDIKDSDNNSIGGDSPDILDEFTMNKLEKEMDLEL